MNNEMIKETLLLNNRLYLIHECETDADEHFYKWHNFTLESYDENNKDWNVVQIIQDKLNEPPRFSLQSFTSADSAIMEWIDIEDKFNIRDSHRIKKCLIRLSDYKIKEKRNKGASK